MATAAPHVKLLRQLASAKDDYLSGAFDISWDGAKATLYLVFGRPSHAVFDTDQAQIEGEAAIDALLAELPRTFVVSDWRRAMSPQETLSISIDELAGPFVRLAGSYADDPVSDENPEWWSSDDSSPDLAFGLADFPLLPGGRPLWAETSPENVNLAERLAELPPSILILTGAKLRAAAVVSGGDIIDAVWIDDEDQARGEAAGMAILGASKGTLAGYALDDPRVAEALTMLWRLPRAVDGIEMAWLDPASMLAAFRADGLDRVLVIDAPVRGIALFSRGGLVAVYSETQRSAVASPERLRSLLSQARGRLTVMERKPRPVAAGAAHTIPSAVDFFSVVAEPEPEAEAASAAEPEAASEHAAPAVADATAVPAVADEVATAVAEPESAEATVSEPAGRTGPAQGSVAEEAAETEPGAEAPAQAFAAAEPAAGTTDTEPESATTEPESATTEPESATTEPAVEHATEAVATGPESEADALPPPPPGDAGVAAAEHAPPPPAPEGVAEPARKAKRHWWAFGTRRKSSTQAPSEADRAAAEAAAAREAAEAASSAGWGIRQLDAGAPPPWTRPRDYVLGDTETADDGTEAPPPAPEAAAEETATQEPASTWSVIEPGATHTHWPVSATTEASGDAQQTEPAAASPADEVSAPPATEPAEGEAAPSGEPDESDAASTGEPAAAAGAPEVEAVAAHAEDTGSTEPASVAAPAWSAREVIADSVSWYQPPQHPDASSEAPADAAQDAAEDSGAGDAVAGVDHELPAPGDDEQETLAAAEHEPAAEDDQKAPAEADHDVAAAEHEPAAEADHDVAAAEHEPAAEADHEASTEADHDVAAESADIPAAEASPDTTGEQHEHDEGEEEIEPVADAHPETDTARDFWAEFATPDHDASAEDQEQEPEPLAVTETTAGTDEHIEDESEAAVEPDSEAEHAPVAADDAEPLKRKSSGRTFAPWNWPLAEAETPVAPASVGRPAPVVDEEPALVTAEAATEPAPHDAEPDDHSAADQSFFQRDEPVGSQFVDFDEVRKELVQIGVVWLGERNAIPVTALLVKTRSTIDDFVATIDTIRGLHVDGQDPASIQAMAREMHQQAAERLCGA